MKAIYKRELETYLNSPIGYIFIGVFLTFFSLFFYLNNLSQQSANLLGVFSQMTIVTMILISIISMMLMSKESAGKTDQLLYTAPVSPMEIVLGKYFAACTLIAICFVGTIPHIAILFVHGSPAIAQLILQYVGFYLVAMAYLSIGIFISSLTQSNVVAAILTLTVFVVLLILEFFVRVEVTNSILVTILSSVSIIGKFNGFLIGMVDISTIIYYISIIAVFLTLTVARVEGRRWK